MYKHDHDPDSEECRAMHRENERYARYLSAQRAYDNRLPEPDYPGECLDCRGSGRVPTDDSTDPGHSMECKECGGIGELYLTRNQWVEYFARRGRHE